MRPQSCPPFAAAALRYIALPAAANVKNTLIDNPSLQRAHPVPDPRPPSLSHLADGSGSINTEELCSMMKVCCPDMDESTVVELIDYLDTSGDGTLELSEFVLMMTIFEVSNSDVVELIQSSLE